MLARQQYGDSIKLSILHWRCLPAHYAVHKAAAETLSILHWRCYPKIDGEPKADEKELLAFNTPLEMQL